MQLMDIFDVGSYNDFTGDTPDRAKRYMGGLFATDPFVPYLVDAANFKVRFINPVSVARADDIAHAVAEFDLDAYGLVSAPGDPESGDEAADPVELLREFILKEQKLDLWWD
jgi:hypothetical protein